MERHLYVDAKISHHKTLACYILRRRPRRDWSDASTATPFYGREWELNLLASWIVEDRCRVVSVLGPGGIGKSALATRAMHQVAEHFEVAIWRSLRDSPTCETLLDGCTPRNCDSFV
jgi:hypothetical protein